MWLFHWFSQHFPLIMYWFCWEKIDFSHSWELEGHLPRTGNSLVCKGIPRLYNMDNFCLVMWTLSLELWTKYQGWVLATPGGLRCLTFDHGWSGNLFFSNKNPMLSTLAFTLYRFRALGSLQFFLEDNLAFFTFMMLFFCFCCNVSVLYDD